MGDAVKQSLAQRALRDILLPLFVFVEIAVSIVSIVLWIAMDSGQ